MHWLSFFIGALVGWLVCWLVDYLICRPRRVAAEALLNSKLKQCEEECAALRERGGVYGDLQARLDAANAEVAALKEQLATLKGVQADLVACKAQAAEQGLEIERLKAELAARMSGGAAAATGVLATGAPAVEPVEPDDLTLIEGIGPKISSLLNQSGIYTFAQLAAASVERLQSILSAAGPRFRLADPQTWAQQAGLARDGKWDELKTLQDAMKGGRAV